MSFANFIITRSISTTAVRDGKRNFRKFPVFSKRGSREFKKRQIENPDPEMPVHTRGVRLPGYTDNDGKFVFISEKVPELIVPNLKECKFKPYVSYRAPDVIQSEFTAQDLFNVVYAPKIAKDHEQKKLDADGYPVEPSPEEKMTPEEAKIKARQTGTDIFQ